MNFPMLDSFLTMLWFFLWVMWLFLLFRVVVDIFRDDTLSGATKAAWLIFILVLPYLGVLVYLIMRGSGMGARAAAEMQARHEAVDNYIRTTAASGGGAGMGTSQADELAKLAALKADGTLSEDEFQHAKARLLV